MAADLREIDRLVAEHVMGYPEVECSDDSCTWRNGPEDGWRFFMPTEDIAAAWQIVEKLTYDRYYVDINNADELWACIIGEYHNLGEVFTASENTAQLAICLAALKAKGIEVPDA